ncbi:conserved hypothetical protein [Histoplasma capsulatum G186AR]|uniref:Septin-type G domain-containing protein n=2 Tax=Ajellomyces capsulatus TaxID=5037 RepID=C0NLS4_AJECG|nr:uncharacterized protein HCBG_04454 [Histoplasma capsulatum G186AR]EEH07574.1 conserved hypothetical protein [Histoplasma capsulatum G186AR]KAG5304285.1 septin, cell division protein Sep4a [Histoplasma capsulatum]QSS69883.1 septin, cell division protein Sep4a [Histoplasma capsulatum G186AR]
MSSPAPPTPGRSSPPDALPTATENGSANANSQTVRRTSLGFLRRSKSTEPLSGDRKASGGRMSKRMQKEMAKEELLRRQREAGAVAKYAPRLPDLPAPPQLKTFGGENARQMNTTAIPNRGGSYIDPSAPASPYSGVAGGRGSEVIDPYARTESMTHRGRYSYASSAVSTINSPRRVRRRKDPTPYNILVIGARKSGKTSFLNFLRTSLQLPPKKRPTRAPDEFEEPVQMSAANNNFTSHYLETEIDGERVGLTLWDSQGLESNVVDLQLRGITSFLESKFEETFNEEMKVIRAPGVRDTHIHCAFLILDPARLDANIAAAQESVDDPEKSSSVRLIGGLDENLDIQVIRTMQGMTTVVPIISKADTITTGHMAFLKKTVWESLKKAGLDPLEVLTLEDQDDTSSSDGFDRFDEQDEDDLNQQEDDDAQIQTQTETDAEAKRPTTGRRTPDSDTVPLSPPNPQSPTSRQNNGGIRKSSTSVSSINANLNANGEYPFLPLSILSPDPYSLEDNNGPIGRKFPWGFADPYNPEHCDFVKLKDTVFGEWRGELREASREVWYERWRTSRLNNNGNGPSGSSSKNGVRGGSGRSGRATR